MRLLYSFVIGLFATFTLTALAHADNYKVPPNKTSVLTFYYIYSDDTCAFGTKPTFKVLTSPEHGTVHSKWMKINLKDVRKNCQGKPVYGTAIIYTPNKGFHGKDFARVGLGESQIPMTLSSGSRALSFDITVE